MGLNPSDGVPTLEQMSGTVPPTTTQPTSESQGEGMREENPTVSLESGESEPIPGKPEDAPEAKEEEKGETPSTDAQKQVQEIIEGWKEDRMLLDKATKENRELKDSVRDLKSRLSRYEASDESGEGEEERGNLSEKEIIERYEAKKNEESEAQKAEVSREIAFLERTDPYFREHKQAILKTAADFNASNLNQAIKIHKAQRVVAEKAKQQQPKSKPIVNTPRYNPETDSNLSIREMYLRGGRGA